MEENKTLKVLIIEDSPLDYALLLRQFKKYDFLVRSHQVDTEETTRAALLSEPWDVILCDYNLPAFNPLRALEILREVGQDIPFIIVSGIIGEETAVAAMRAGAHDYLLKDNLIRLIPAIEREIKEANLRKAKRHQDGLLQAQLEILNQTQKDLRSALYNRDEFLSIASHELKTPLTSLKIHLQSLLRKFAKKEIQEASGVVKSSLEAAERQIWRLEVLINDLLDVSRISNGKLNLIFEPCHLEGLIQEIEARFSEAFLQAKCTFEANVDPHIVGIWDQHRIDQVFSNLLSNAIKYAPGSKIKVNATQNGHGVSICVEDSGPGIPSENLTRIFERFERARKDLVIQGLGLGLYIVKSIITTHGGTITAENSPTGGTRFLIDLPLEGSAINAGGPYVSSTAQKLS